MTTCPTDDASEAMREAHAAAVVVEMLLDRYWGDAGSDPALVHGWRARLVDLAFEIRRELGEPKERTPEGGLVSPSFLKLYQK